MKKYTTKISNGDSQEFSRKEQAVKYGDESGESYVVLSPSGMQVHEVTLEKKFDLAKMKSKIEKLLAKAEGTDSEEERESFNEAAERLMLKLGIERAELESEGAVKPEDIVQEHIHFDDNYSSEKVKFVYSLALGFGDLTCLQTTRTVKPYRTIHIIGHKTDVKMFLILANSMLLQATSGLHRFQRENAEERRLMSDWDRYVQNRSYLSGFASEVQKRLRDLRKNEPVTSGAELVLANKQEKIDNWVADNIGETRKGRGGNKAHDSVGYINGRVAGSEAALGGKSVTSKKG